MLPRPMGDAVLLEVMDSEVQYAPFDMAKAREGAAVIMPNALIASTADRMYKRARVLAVGPGKRHPATDALAPVFCATGDLVVYEDWMVQWHDGIGTWPGPGDHALVRAPHVVAVITDPDVWLDFPRVHGEQPTHDPRAFDPSEAGGRRNPGALKRLGLSS